MDKNQLNKSVLLLPLDMVFSVIAVAGAAISQDKLIKDPSSVLSKILPGATVQDAGLALGLTLALCLVAYLLFGVYKKTGSRNLSIFHRIAAAALVTIGFSYLGYRIIFREWMVPSFAILAFYYLLTMSGGFRLLPLLFQKE